MTRKEKARLLARFLMRTQNLTLMLGGMREVYRGCVSNQTPAGYVDFVSRIYVSTQHLLESVAMPLDKRGRWLEASRAWERYIRQHFSE